MTQVASCAATVAAMSRLQQLRAVGVVLRWGATRECTIQFEMRRVRQDPWHVCNDVEVRREC